MKPNNITLMIIADEAKPSRKLVIPVTWVKVSSFVVVLLFVLFGALSLDYFGLLLEVHENKQLKIENLQLLKQFQIVETKVSALESALDRIKTFSTKLKLITNVEDENRGLKLSVGVGPKPNQALMDSNQPLEHRPPFAQTEVDDAAFTEAQPPNEGKGELAVEVSRDYSTLAVRIDQAVQETQLREQSIVDLWETLAERQSLLNSTPSIRPTRGWLSSRFGYRVSPVTGKPAMHAGLDFAANPGTPIFAPADGIVTYAAYDETYGNLVTIDHGYGVMTRYGHNSQIYVHIGQKVSRWDVISAVGSTGRSTGPHLHYEVRINNVPVDPINYLLDE